ncbi:MAG TPA: ABC transporter permease [Mycobacteriales bacterium]|nr:ABC transporter permease [Mycobacteriales bacterium]
MSSPTSGRGAERDDQDAAPQAGASSSTGVSTGSGSGAAVVAASGGAVDQAGLWGDVWRQLRRSPQFLFGATVVAVFVVMAAVPQLFTRTDPRACNLARSRQQPSSEAWFGYDVQGCDYYANVIYGARASISIGLLVVLGGLLIGLTLGAVAGYRGGWIDILIARVTDVFFGLPLILGAILVLQAFTSRGILLVSFALAILSWMVPMRLVRSSVVALRDSDYVLAARALGANDRRIVLRHVLPNSLAPVLVYSTISIGVVISAEAALSFLGIGLQLPAISWGLMIGNAQNFLRTSPFLLWFPGAFLTLTVLAFISLGDALRDALDPKLR